MDTQISRITEAIYEHYRDTGQWPTRMYLGRKEVSELMVETNHQATVKWTDEEFKTGARKRTFMDVEWFPVSTESHFFIV